MIVHVDTVMHEHVHVDAVLRHVDASHKDVDAITQYGSTVYIGIAMVYHH